MLFSFIAITAVICNLSISSDCKNTAAGGHPCFEARLAAIKVWSSVRVNVPNCMQVSSIVFIVLFGFEKNHRPVVVSTKGGCAQGFWSKGLTSGPNRSFYQL